jgi:hypothetical protein
MTERTFFFVVHTFPDFELLGFWTLSIVQHSKKKKQENTPFRKLDLFN